MLLVSKDDELSLNVILDDAPTHHFKFKGVINGEQIIVLIDSEPIEILFHNI